MTGRAGTAKGVAFGLYILIGEGVRGRGGCWIDPGGRLVDFFIGVMLALFSSFFQVFF